MLTTDTSQDKSKSSHKATDGCRTSTWCVKYWWWIFFFKQTQIRSDAASCITTDGTPLKFVSTGNLTTADKLTFCWPIRNAVCYVYFLDMVSKLSRGWMQVILLTALSPHPLPHRFLFWPWFSFLRYVLHAPMIGYNKSLLSHRSNTAACIIL